MPSKKPGPGIWKFNNSLLIDELYDQAIKELITNMVEQYAVPIYATEFVRDQNNFSKVEFTISSHMFYETLLMMIRGETVRFAKRKARKFREEEDKICKEISRISQHLSNCPGPDTLQRLDQAQQKLEDKRKVKIKGPVRNEVQGKMARGG